MFSLNSRWLFVCGMGGISRLKGRADMVTAPTKRLETQFLRRCVSMGSIMVDEDVVDAGNVSKGNHLTGGEHG